MATKQERDRKFGQKRDDAARAEGWSSFGQKYRAGQFGITDPVVWADRCARAKPTPPTPPTPAAKKKTTTAAKPAPASSPPADDLPTSWFEHLPLDRVHDADDNVRRVVSLDDEFVQSVQSVGILQPVVVEELPNATGYRVVMGHRRVAAARLLAFDTVPCVVQVELPTPARIEAMLVENLHREDLDPFDEAFGYASLVELGHTQRQIAARVGKGQPHISRRLALLDLDDVLVPYVLSGAMPLRSAEALVRAGDAHQRVAIAQLEGVDVDDVLAGELDADWVAAVERVVEREQLVATGEESGLPVWDGEWWEMEDCARDAATHWALDATSRTHPRIVWGREREQAPTPAAPRGPKPATPPDHDPEPATGTAPADDPSTGPAGDTSPPPRGDTSSGSRHDGTGPDTRPQAEIVAERAAWRARVHERADVRIDHVMRIDTVEFNKMAGDVLVLAKFDLYAFDRDAYRAFDLVGPLGQRSAGHDHLEATLRDWAREGIHTRPLVLRAFTAVAVERIARTVSRENVSLDVARYMWTLRQTGLTLTVEEHEIARHWDTELHHDSFATVQP